MMMKTKTLVIIASIVGGIFVVLVGSYLIYCIREAKKAESFVTTTSETSLGNMIQTSSEPTLKTTETAEVTETTESTLSAEQLQSQIDENNRQLESLQSESESLRLESESIEASISESIVESEIQASIDESISESIAESQRQEATRTTKESTKQTEPPSETTKAPKETTSKPKGDPKLSKSTITISAGDTDSFVAQASDIYVMNTNVSASLDYSGVSFNTPGTYTAYFNAFDGSYSLPLTVIVQ